MNDKAGDNDIVDDSYNDCNDDDINYSDVMIKKLYTFQSLKWQGWGGETSYNVDNDDYDDSESTVIMITIIYPIYMMIMIVM